MGLGAVLASAHQIRGGVVTGFRLQASGASGFRLGLGGSHLAHRSPVYDPREAMLMNAAIAVLCIAPMTAAGEQAIERQVVLTITPTELDGGILTEITWDNGALLLQGAVANPDGTLSARYVVVPAKTTALSHLKQQTDASVDYWNRKSKRVSPTGLGRIESSTDARLPMYGIGGLERRVNDAVDMGGMQQKHVLRLNRLVLFEREGGVEPYDGEFWSWSPAELNRITYVDGKGDLWVASSAGSGARRLLKGDFTLPAWSDDGAAIALADKTDGGRRWEIIVVWLPDDLRSAR